MALQMHAAVCGPALGAGRAPRSTCIVAGAALRPMTGAACAVRPTRCCVAPAASRALSSRRAVCAPLHSAAPPPRRRAVASAPRASAGPLLELAQGLEAPVQIAYLTALLALLAGGSYLVVRQVLVRRELEESAKALGERVRDGSASAEELFEMGCVMLRKKVYTQAVRQLEAALAAWDGEAEERAQVHNALGFALAAQDKTAPALEQYRAAVALQPGYVTAWNNMGDTLEKTKAYKEALDAYSEALSYAPDNAIARDRAAFLRTRIARTAL